MPQSKSREKDLRRSLQRRTANRNRKREMRAAVRDALAVAAKGTEAEVADAVKAAQRNIDLAEQKGPLHARAAARRKSRLVARVRKASEARAAGTKA
jgi:small subunit ribosomal protein S20